MRMIDLIIKKRDGGHHTDAELEYIVKGISDGTIPDYQIAAWLMAVKFIGMNEHETAYLTHLMMHSGDTIDLSAIKGITVDKHSTGGVGDKTSLALGPMVAACGVKVAKMSGRGLGHTGGTLDKLEAIPGVSVSMSREAFIRQVNDIGLAILGQTGALVPADKKLYALRDVTGTVESMPLIAGSIMSKKLASGADTILLDVKFGQGAFMKTLDDARELAKTMVAIGKSLKRDTRAIITDMQQPLGLAVGNILEVKEAIATLHGHGPADFVELCLAAGSIMLLQAHAATSIEQARSKLIRTIEDGSAFQKLCEMIASQGGDLSYIKQPDKFDVSRHIVPIRAERDGHIATINALAIGEAAMKLGAGRAKKEDVIDFSAGIVLNKKVADQVITGDILAYAHTNIEQFSDVLDEIKSAFIIQQEPVTPGPIVYEIIE
ncbi:MAG TPA: pyrimidine-nucleoside phosphorylase [Bacilli bacterium]|nr:pyrimidine-nucleoside phosphorylase [Bacilli bacterium]